MGFVPINFKFKFQMTSFSDWGVKDFYSVLKFNCEGLEKGHGFTIAKWSLFQDFCLDLKEFGR